MRINGELSRHFDEILRDYLLNYVPEHWDEMTGTGEDDATLAYLLCRRIAASPAASHATALGESCPAIYPCEWKIYGCPRPGFPTLT